MLQLTSIPTIKVEGVRVPKLLIGTNSLLGWSHTSVGRDRWIKRYYSANRIGRVFERCIKLGANGVFGPVWPRLIEAIKIAEKKTGQQMTFISTTIGKREDTEKQLKMLNGMYSPICCIHGGWTDSWPVENGKLVGFEKYLQLIRKAGLVPGVACHNGDKLKLVNDGGYDVSVLVTPVNRLGFQMHPNQKMILDVIRSTQKPVIAIKPLASGRFDEGKISEWLEWVLKQNGVSALCIGFMNQEEAEEDIAIMNNLCRLS